MDIADPHGNATMLLQSVENVYVQNMTAEDEKNKLLREKIHTEEQNELLRGDVETLQTQGPGEGTAAAGLNALR